MNGFGTQILAGFSAAMRIESLCCVPMSSIGNALSWFGAPIWGVAIVWIAVPLGVDGQFLHFVCPL